MDKTKSLVIMVLVLGLVLEQQSQLVHANSCCPSRTARRMYNACRVHQGASRETCARFARCKIVQGKCKDPHYIVDQSPYSDSEVANVVLEFCKSGCTSSVCNNIKTAVLQEDANDDAVDRCGEACHRFCTNTKHVDTATNVS
ncbi:unnamed protein product [Miscanthus lutarioriparius]|uniref:Acidic protein n=1 Tax=Miscanthus lutarioriparius TaxID=422564 RepID=A0A811MF12_9POAL|nr:unnamed protein product [Miscanthus lutarioriparius]